jgi:Uncharacterized protein conserved in bacteria (DUF2252)
LLIDASRDRLPELLPIKWGRMAASPFGFFRGAVPPMAADLASLPTIGINVQICGDAHVRNLALSPRLQVLWFLTSTTLMKPFRVRGSGTSSG